MYKNILIAFFVFTFVVSSQSTDDVNNLLKKALSEFESKNWSSALKIFNKIAFESVENSRTSLALLFIGKVNLELRNYHEAEIAIISLLENFPSSKFADEARFTLSKIFLEQQKYQNAFWQLCELMNVAKDKNYRTNAKNVAEKIAINYLSLNELKAVADTISFHDIKPFLILTTAKKYYAEGFSTTAQETLIKLIRTYPQSEEKKEAQLFLERNSKTKINTSDSDVIAVILPLTQSLSVSKPALEILEGIKYSLDEFNRNRERKVGIIIRDTEMNRSKIEHISEELGRIENLRCIIGPIFSSEVKEALDVLKDINIPIISPTATEDYLTTTHPNFFQANPTFVNRGKLMAQYVYFSENKSKIGILNCVDGYSPILSSSFAQEFERLGGKVIVREAYRSGSTELKDQIQGIAERLNQLDGLYIPLADKIDIPILISQLSQLDLKLTIYGDQDWMNPTELGSAAFLENNLIFCSDYFIKFEDSEYQKFSKEFTAKTKLDVNRNVLYGYDAMKFVLTCLRLSGFGTNSLMQKMISGITSIGYKNNISFDSNRINLYLNIIRYSKGRFELINKFKLRN